VAPRPGPSPWRSALGRSFFLLPPALDYVGSSDGLFASAAEHEMYLAVLQETFDQFEPWRPVGGLRGEGARWEGESWAVVDRFLDAEDERCADLTKRPAAPSVVAATDVEGEVGGWMVDSLGDHPLPPARAASPSSLPSTAPSPDRLVTLRPTWRAAAARERPTIAYDALPLTAGAVGDSSGPLAVSPVKKQTRRARLKALLPVKCGLCLA